VVLHKNRLGFRKHGVEQELELPTFRFNKAIGMPRGGRVFLNIEVGARRDATQDDIQRQDRELAVAKQQIREQRRSLAKKEREITQLRMKLSAGNGRSGGNTESQAASQEVKESQVGVLPDFLIIGTQKGGTTFLYRLLGQHPQVEPATTKEVHYFDVNFQKGERWYRSHFPTPELKKQHRAITGEASPYYMFHPHAARRAALTVPRAKVITLLRNPVDRAYSDYQHKFREGRDTLGFEEAIEAEGERLRGERDRMLADEHYASLNYRKFSYLSRGIYADQLQDWHNYFGWDQTLVLKSEDLFDRPLETWKLVLEFLGLPLWQPGSAELGENPDLRHQGAYAQMAPDTRQRLEDYFEPHNQRLYEYLGVDLGW
jgi:hypothetical protein